jgi:hypothetical protein
MTSIPTRTAAKRVATKTYYEHGVRPVAASQVARNYAGFIVGVVFTLVIYLVAQAFGI